MKKSTLSIADNHPIVLFSLETLISAVPIFDLVNICSCSDSLLSALSIRQTDIIVTDLPSPSEHLEKDSLKLLNALRTVAPGSRIILYTAEVNVSLLRTALDAGVCAIISKIEKPKEIVQACLHVSAGVKRYVSPSLRRKLNSKEGRSKRQTLTSKETEVIKLLSQGYSLTSIANLKGLTVNAISARKRSAMSKFGTQSNIELIQRATEQGYV